MNNNEIARRNAVIAHLRQLADELEASENVYIESFDTSTGISGCDIRRSLDLRVYSSANAENVSGVFGINVPQTLEN